MTALGLDYSAGRPLASAIYNAGYRFVVRYLDNGLAGRANLTAVELTALRGAGVAVAVVWESTANRAAAGRDAGVADAHAAQAALDTVGAGGLPVYFAVDFDLPDYAPAATSPLAKLGPVGDYFAGIASVLPHARVGVYGGYYAVSRVLDAGLAAWAWQTVGWSGGQVDPRIHLFQRLGSVVIDGVECDTNEARQDQFGQNPQGADMSDLDTPIDRPNRTPITLAQFVASADDVTDETRSETKAGFAALAQQVTDLATKVAAIGTPTVDLDALAAKVAAHIHLSGSVVAQGDQPTS